MSNNRLTINISFLSFQSHAPQSLMFIKTHDKLTNILHQKFFIIINGYDQPL